MAGPNRLSNKNAGQRLQLNKKKNRTKFSQIKLIFVNLVSLITFAVSSFYVL